jgi:hypothetical protein
VCTDRSTLRGYLNPARLPGPDPLELLTQSGENRPIPLKDVRAVYFVRDFDGNYQSERKAFFSRPKLDGLWVRLKFRDEETIEGIITNDLLSLLDSGVQITPPDFSAGALRIFVPRSSLLELTVLGVVGVARRKPAAIVPAQPRLFES